MSLTTYNGAYRTRQAARTNICDRTDEVRDGHPVPGAFTGKRHLRRQVPEERPWRRSRSLNLSSQSIYRPGVGRLRRADRPDLPEHADQLELTALPEDVFADLTSLTFLNLSTATELSALPEDVFDNADRRWTTLRPVRGNPSLTLPVSG